MQGNNLVAITMTLNLREFNAFFTEYQQRFVHFATTYIHDEVAAEDLVIESMMYYWENKERLADDTNVPAYVLTTLKHKCIDHLRHQQKVMQTQKEIGDLQKWDLDFRASSLKDFEPDNVFTHEIQDIVNKTLASLPEKTRQIFMLSRYEDMPNKEIAAKLGLSVKSVEFHITKSNKALREALKDHLPLIIAAFILSLGC